MTTTTVTLPRYSADAMRAAINFAEYHDLDGDLSQVGAPDLNGEVSVLLHAQESGIAMAITWAKALGVNVIKADEGPRNYHLRVNSTLLDGTLPFEVTVLTRPDETTAIRDAGAGGTTLPLDEIARFIPADVQGGGR